MNKKIILLGLYFLMIFLSCQDIPPVESLTPPENPCGCKTILIANEREINLSKQKGIEENSPVLGIDFIREFENGKLSLNGKLPQLIIDTEVREDDKIKLELPPDLVLEIAPIAIITCEQIKALCQDTSLTSEALRIKKIDLLGELKTYTIEALKRRSGQQRDNPTEPLPTETNQNSMDGMTQFGRIFNARWIGSKLLFDFEPTVQLPIGTSVNLLPSCQLVTGEIHNYPLGQPHVIKTDMVNFITLDVGSLGWQIDKGFLSLSGMQVKVFLSIPGEGEHFICILEHPRAVS
jgi:hypothetical protein